MKSTVVKKYLNYFFEGFESENLADGSLYVYFENREDALIITDEGNCFIDKDLKRIIKTMFSLDKQEFNEIFRDWIYDKFKRRVYNII